MVTCSTPERHIWEMSTEFSPYGLNQKYPINMESTKFSPYGLNHLYPINMESTKFSPFGLNHKYPMNMEINFSYHIQI